MIEKEVCLSSKNQIVIPKEVRESMQLKSGDRLYLTVSTLGHIELWKRPNNYTKYLKGLGKDTWKGIDIEGYVESIREDWN